jgi:hypothetical protein
MCKLVPTAIGQKSGSSSPGRATASQAVGSGFESRLPLCKLIPIVAPATNQKGLKTLLLFRW